MNDKNNFDVIIIGGSYSGLSAAMALGRSLRRVLILDSGLPCNRQTPHSHNFITQDGVRPSEIAELAKKQVLQYDSVKFLNDLAISGSQTEQGFSISTQAGETFSSKKLIFATGIKDKLPDIKGFSECWGISVIHCPYCHGYEFRNQKTGIFANAEKAYHLSTLLHNLTDDITMLSPGKATFDSEQLAKLKKYNIRIVEKEIAEIEHEHGQVKQVLFTDNSKMAFDAVYASVAFEQHTDIPVSLGCELTELGYIKVDNFQKTTIKGVFACGDNATAMRSVSYAVAAGGIAASMVNKELSEEQF